MPWVRRLWAVVRLVLTDTAIVGTTTTSSTTISSSMGARAITSRLRRDQDQGDTTAITTHHRRDQDRGVTKMATTSHSHLPHLGLACATKHPAAVKTYPVQGKAYGTEGSTLSCFGYFEKPQR